MEDSIIIKTMELIIDIIRLRQQWGKLAALA
jgi:hypothetical protein